MLWTFWTVAGLIIGGVLVLSVLARRGRKDIRGCLKSSFIVPWLAYGA
jgi:hypothetical protein